MVGVGGSGKVDGRVGHYIFRDGYNLLVDQCIFSVDSNASITTDSWLAVWTEFLFSRKKVIICVGGRKSRKEPRIQSWNF